MSFKNKKVVVLGAGISGMAVAGVLQKNGAKVVLSDAKPAELFGNKDFGSLTGCGIELALGRQDEQLLDGIDYVVVSPGISIEIPLIKMALSRDIVVMSEIEVAYRLCPAPIVAITGTNGKTTTTTLIGEMMKTKYQDVVVGGNIGLALSQEVADIGPDGIVVAEISSFQLEGVIDFHPHIAAVLNITPDHLDRHHTMDSYVEMKERVFAHQTQHDYLVLNYDDEVVRQMSTRAQSDVFFFSRLAELSSGIFIKDHLIQIAWKGDTFTLCAVDQIKLRGGHNVENVLAACAIAFLSGVALRDMVKTIEAFMGVEHRIEPVKTIHDVAYYNDSKATNPESSIKALESFSKHIILIAGGRDKNTDLTVFMELIKEKVDHLILLGEAQARFREAAQAHGVRQIHDVASLGEGVQLAHQLAASPQVVLLSPACASYDMFKSYEERGRVFKNLVDAL